MKIIATKELKSIEVEMLKSIHRFCIDNNIKYSLAFGTLLGAVRHKGFIPWDDDIDIMMPRADYERFIMTFQHPYYKVLALENDNNYVLPYAKAFDDRTILIEKSELEDSYGVFIDIFPIDNIIEDKKNIDEFHRKKKYLNRLFTLKRVSLRKGRAFTKNITLAVSRVFLLPISARSLALKINNLVAKYSKVNSEKSGVVIPTDNKPKSIFPSEVFNSFTTLEFEGYKFMAIAKYDQYLSTWYGDYMKLPPLEKQVSHHLFKAWWKEQKE